MSDRKNGNKPLYIDDEVITQNQAVANLVNVKWRGVESTPEILNTQASNIEQSLDSLRTEENGDYIDKLKYIVDIRHKLAVALDEVIRLATLSRNKLEGFPRISKFENNFGEEELSVASFTEWAELLLLANGMPHRLADVECKINVHNIPGPKQTIEITLASVLILLAEVSDHYGKDGVPRWATISRQIKIEGMYGQSYENLRVALKKAIETRDLFLRDKGNQ